MTAKALAEERRSSAAREREALQAQVAAAGEEVARLKEALEVERQRVAAAVAAAASASDTLKEENARLKREWPQQRVDGGACGWGNGCGWAGGRRNCAVPRIDLMAGSYSCRQAGIECTCCLAHWAPVHLLTVMHHVL
jgi:hypothetical protein